MTIIGQNGGDNGETPDGKNHAIFSAEISDGQYKINIHTKRLDELIVAEKFLSMQIENTIIANQIQQNKKSIVSVPAQGMPDSIKKKLGIR